MTCGRRGFLQGIFGAIALKAAQESVRVPWSSGIEAPTRRIPAYATDCHHHIYDSRFPVDPKAKLRPGDATVADYSLLQKRLGIERHVIVQPSTYGVDNRCMVDALKQFGKSARGIAVVNNEVTVSELNDLQAAGVCGIRFNVVQAGSITLDMVEPLAKRIAALGWHVQVNASPDQILLYLPVWQRLPVPLVFDHLGHAAAPDHPAFVAISRLLQSGKCWLKLSGAYMDTKVGPPTYSDRSAVARAYLKQAPERLVWGTDWPHPTEATDRPDDALLLNLLGDWCASKTIWNRVLVDNPKELYSFTS